MSEGTPLRIGTRGSKLALYQANYVKDVIASRLGRACELIILKTRGDKDRSRPIAELGGVGVFVKELERALLADEIDLAVHSLKDLPTEIPAELTVVAVPIRVSPHEALLVHPDAVDPSRGPIPLGEGARVGTSSLRRQAQLLELRPDLSVVGIRGNVPTRVDKARQREVDAVMLAAAGIDRLELELAGVERFDLPLDVLVPAPGQGALGIEVRRDDAEVVALLQQLDDAAARETCAAERLLLHGLGVGCSVPLGTHATREGDRIRLDAVFQAAAGQPLLRACVRGSSPEAVAALGLQVLQPAPPAAGGSLKLEGKTVLVARDPERAAELIRSIEARGGQARSRTPTKTAHLPVDGAEVAEALDWLGDDGWLLFASVRAVAALARHRADLAAAVGGRPVGAVGRGTARALGAQGVAVDLLPERSTGAGLAAAVLARLGEARPKVFLPAAKGGRAELRDTLRAAGCDVRVVELYESVAGDPPTAEELAVDAIVLTSPSGARATLAGPAPASECKLVAIGPTTAAELERLGVSPAAIAEQPTTAGLLAAIDSALRS